MFDSGLPDENWVEISGTLWSLLNLANDEDFVRLKDRYFGQSALDLGTAGRWGLAKGRLGPFPIRTLHPLTGWESPAWSGCHEWDAQRWRKLAQTLAQSSGWDFLKSLGHSPDEGKLFSQALTSEGLNHFATQGRVRVIHGFSNWESYFKSRPRQFKDRYKSTFKLAQAHHLELRTEIDHGQMAKLYAKRRLGASDDYSKDPRFQAFLKDLVDTLKAQGRLQQVGAFQGDRLVAMALGFWREKVFFFYQTAYDPDLRRVSPGSLVLYRLIEDVLERGAELFTFMGEFAYMRIYTRQVLKTCQVTVFKNSPYGRWLGALLRLNSWRRPRSTAG